MQFCDTHMFAYADGLHRHEQASRGASTGADSRSPLNHATGVGRGERYDVCCSAMMYVANSRKDIYKLIDGRKHQRWCHSAAPVSPSTISICICSIQTLKSIKLRSRLHDATSSDLWNTDIKMSEGATCRYMSKNCHG